MTIIPPTKVDPLTAFVQFIADSLPSDQLRPMLEISNELLHDGAPMPLAGVLPKFVSELKNHLGEADNGHKNH